MSTSKHIDKICCIVLALCLIVTLLFMNGNAFGIQSATALPAYASKLFDTARVHKIEIYMDNWDSFIETCTNEEYSPCTVIIDNEAYKNVAIRAKGNTSLSSVRSYDNDRYSFKIEFDGYDSSTSYYGLDKLCLNNLIQDNTYMKDHLVYTMMREAGASAPLSSYAEIHINGEYFGLYLAVESVEDSFLLRNYGNSYGELYKPDSMNMGGGRGNGRDFNPENPIPERTKANDTTEPRQSFESLKNEERNFPGNRDVFGKGMPGGMNSSDVSLIYSDDNPQSYSNIFENAKTDITEKDKTRLISALKNLNSNTDIENTVDISEVISYFVAHNFVLNFDSYTGTMMHNYYLYEESGKLSMIPWDYNLAFGGFHSQADTNGLVNYPIDTPVSGGTIQSRPMLAWIFANEEYTELYHKKFSNFIESFFGSGKFEKMIDSTCELISPYVMSDPSKFCTYEEFESGVATLKKFCILRAESISGQLSGTIPSTSDKQATENSTFVVADALEVSAMGSMGHGGMGRGDRLGNDAPFPEAPVANFPDSMQPPGMPGEHFPGGMHRQENDVSDLSPGNNILLLSVSLLTLFFGLLFAFFYKRK